MTSTHEQTMSGAPSVYADAAIQRIAAANGIEYAYRDVGEGEGPLVLLQHFRGNVDNWDPALIDALASSRRVVLASSAPQGAPGMHGWAPDVIGAVGQPETNPQGYVDVFFAHSATSREAGQQAAARIFGRTTERDEPTTWQTRQAQYDAVCAWGIPNHSLLERVTAIDHPVFVANGDGDPMILPRYSYLLAGLLPDARLTINPDSAHGFLFQHHSRFAADVDAFLAEPD